MRQVINLNQNWLFTKEAASPTALSPDHCPGAQNVTLPHTWNAIDGQDGGNDYYRGKCCYVKELSLSDFPQTDCYYLEFCGASSSAEVYLDGTLLSRHDGGYSAFRVNITEKLRQNPAKTHRQENSSPAHVLVVAVDNSPNEQVYPQMADFTFYGGLYRNVNLICVSESHFDLDTYGTPGIKVTPTLSGKCACVTIETPVINSKSGQELIYTIWDKEENTVAVSHCEAAAGAARIEIPDVTLWNGRKNPYLYTAKAELSENGRILDTVSTPFGCRSFEIDPERGFLLNGEEYPLRGVSRHQDRWGIGNALLPCHHEEDMELIAEMGANTIRLAHYQHDQYFYDLCDRYGMVVWAEIPYISKHLEKGLENTVSQMKELITQNYNHPSIVVWGLSNEITMNGAKDEGLIENHHILNNLAHEMDPTRKTTMACVSMCDINEPYVQIPDVVSYNHYFGWYGGDTSMNGPWFDKFHAAFPQKPIGVSEYGCEGLNWHTSNPVQGDYTEEYQAYYHEELIKQLFPRKYLWATHVWNMFDFGADARNEGGENGQNHKGLVTFDRKYKKDAFYAYKAWLSDEPFVHICGKRYVDRVEEVTKVTVYSNQPEVELFANGISLGKQESPEHFFYFEVPNTGETVLKAVSEGCTDESFIRKTDAFNEDYILKEKGAILNWFDVTVKEGYLSLNDTIASIMKTFRGKLLLMQFAMELMRDMKKSQKPKAEGEKKKDGAMSLKLSSGLLDMMGGFTILRASNMAGMIGVTLTKEQLLKWNKKLNRIKKKN